MRRKYDFKKVDIALWYKYLPKSCLDIVTMYSFCFKTSVEKSPWTKICTENCLNTSIFWLECCLLYSAVDFFHFFEQVWWFPLKCDFTNIRDSSVQLKDREQWLLVLIILEMHSSVALECASCVWFFRNLWVWEKNPLKTCKTTRTEEAIMRLWGQWNRVTHHENVIVERSLYIIKKEES